MRLVVGTRGSRLALTQTESIIALLKKVRRDLSFEKRIIRTTGDRARDLPLARIGGKGVFVKEIDEALLGKAIDIAVHSMKDVPTELHPDLEIAAVPVRERTEDAFLSREGGTLEELPRGAVVGTGSLRRRAEILHFRRDLAIRDLRGNVETRLRKLEAGEYDGIVMAQAGLKRLGYGDRITHLLPLDPFAPSVGQGAIAVAARKDFPHRDLLSSIDHQESHLQVLAERSLLKTLGGGCLVPIGAVSEIQEERVLFLRGVVLSQEGEERIEAEGKGKPEAPEELGAKVGEALLDRGAAEILEGVYGSP
jgi:hydroxymethylbilane synthase